MKNNDQIAILHRSETSIENEFQAASISKGQLLANKIEIAMKQKYYNRQQFASLMGVQPSIITRWLSGNHNFTVETLFEIEDKLEIKLIAVERPANKQMMYHMVVGSEPTQHVKPSIIDPLSGISYFSRINIKFTDDCADNSNEFEFFKFQNK